MKNLRRSDCPITYSLEIIGDRWALLIIRDIIFCGKAYYGEFAKSEEGIASNILADRLKRLEEQGILHKEIDKKKSSKYIYSLTDMGLDILPIMVEMVTFGGKHDANTAIPKSVLTKIKRDKQAFINQLRDQHRNKK